MTFDRDKEWNKHREKATKQERYEILQERRDIQHDRRVREAREARKAREKATKREAEE